MRIKKRCGCLLAVLFVAVTATGHGIADSPAPTDVFQTVAKRGTAATVGVYYEENEFMKFYGTGVIISADGYVLTSTTVVPAGAGKEAAVYFADHTKRAANVVETAAEVEAALLKVDATDLPHLPLAEKLPHLGERTYTLGNARHMMRSSARASFSTGRVTGIYEVGSDPGLSSYAGPAIETDAAINPGQDGGPLLNARGQLAGIVSLSFSDARWLGVAVPISRITGTLDALKKGTVRFSSGAVVTPAPADEASGRRFARCAKELSPYLVKLHVKRRYGPEKMPRYFWPVFVKEHRKEWQKAGTRQRRRMALGFTQTEKLLGANQQLRRPADPTTGVLISADGYILTSRFNVAADTAYVHKKQGIRNIEFDWNPARLAAQAEQYRKERNPVESIRAVLADGRSFPATVVATHTPLRIAVLKIDARDLPHASLSGRSAEPELGRTVAVVGVVSGDRPFTVNTGIVGAAKRRRGRFFQFGGMVNYANSGGPVIDGRGHILGIATEPLRPGPIMGAVLPWKQIARRWYVAPNSGISLAARIDWIKKDLAQLKSGTSVEHLRGAFIGVAMAPRTAFSRGAFVGQVVKGSPARAAGLRPGDQILAVDNRQITSWKDLTNAVGRHDVGDRVVLKVRRKGARRKEEQGNPEKDGDVPVPEETADPGDDADAGPYRILEMPLVLGERK